ncbi:MAG: hypothetical protein CMG64_05870 [Candidatus Marinimicrobia bacterium]|nr:hypothetical protein [Candidatus Neomarinimicrobiota bacterium]
MRKYIILTLLTFSFLLGHEADHIIFTQITITPDEAELIAIYNPTDDPLNLSDYYLSDAEYSITNSHYYNLPTGNDYWSGFSSDFIARFPDINIGSGETLIISLQDASSFNNYYSYNPDLTLTDDMLDAVDGESTIGSSANLGAYEVLILFKWDGQSTSLIQDVDYFYWGDSQGLSFYGVDKTGISTYEDDTPFNTQANNILETHDDDYSYVRKSTTENGESGPSDNITGNGITGHDETSEIFNQSWEIILNPALPEPIAGCTDDGSLESSYIQGIQACNYDENASIDDGSCEYSCIGCMDATAENYVPSATINNQGVCNIEYTTIQSVIEQNEGNECDENLSSSYQIRGLVVGYDDVRPSGGPEVIVLQDDNGYQIEIVVWNWDVVSSAIGFMIDPYDPSEYVMYVNGTLGTYNCSWQFNVAFPDDIWLYDVYHPEGDFNADPNIVKAEIKPAAYVIIPSIGERLDFEYSFPVNSRVTIRIFDSSGRFVMSLVDRFFGDAGTVTRYTDKADWDGRNHLSQIVAPGTYLIHLKTTNYSTGHSSVDIAPIVVGVNY